MNLFSKTLRALFPKGIEMAESFHFDGLARLQNNNDHKNTKVNTRVRRGPRPLDNISGEFCMFETRHS